MNSILPHAFLLSFFDARGGDDDDPLDVASQGPVPVGRFVDRGGISNLNERSLRNFAVGERWEHILRKTGQHVVEIDVGESAGIVCGDCDRDQTSALLTGDRLTVNIIGKRE